MPDTPVTLIHEPHRISVMEFSQSILIIDDNPIIIRLLMSLVEGQATVYFAKTGEEGIKLAKKIQPAVILLDLEMPGMNGLDVCRALKADPDTRDTSILIVTGHDTDAIEVAALEAGAVDFIVKPVNAPIVKARVRTHLTLQQQSAKLRELAHQDGLTGLFNRRAFDASLVAECRRHRRQNLPLGLAFIDIDHFKRYNDHYGHVLGDETLKAVACVLQDAARRPGEVAARYGGEEFAIIVPNATAQDMQDFGDHLCESIRQLGIAHAQNSASGGVTISVGVSSCMPHQDGDAGRMLVAADAALYKAKSGGRNQAVLADCAN